MTSGGSPVLPVDQYVASLARKWMGAGAILRDESGSVLLVKPTYKPTWEVPGGAIEADESPQAACRREVAEELGLDRPVGRLLAVDWIPSRPKWPDGLAIVYDGGVLTPDEISAIRVPEEELAGWAFVAPAQVESLAHPRLARRVAACVRALETGTTASLENGSPTD